MSETTSATTHTGTGIDVSELTVRAGERTLLEKATAAFGAGEITLLLGCSGVGKSVLLRILAGLIGRQHGSIQYSGDVTFTSADGVRRTEADRDQPVAVVFQSFALLDELTPIQNVQIALDHTMPRTKAPMDGEASAKDGGLRRAGALQGAKELLDELRVPTDRPVAVLSGGQQQRLAIARAIAPASDVILYDEPTSGLDAKTARQVADLIQETQQRHLRTSILVTHDHETLSRIADRIILLDHHRKCLRELPKEEWTQIADALGEPPAMAPTAPRATLVNQIVMQGQHALTAFGQFIEDLILLPWALLPLWRSVRWGLRYTWHYLKLVAGPSACVYLAVSGMIQGYVAQDFLFRYLPFRQFTEPLINENLLHATGFALYRFLVPILATILIAARSGAAVASDVGSKVYGNQLDAMRTIGMNPERSLRTPILFAFLIGTPLLSLLSYLMSAIAAAVAFRMMPGQQDMTFWDAHFHHELLHPTSFFYRGTGWLFAKLLTCGAGIALISWRCAVSPKLSGAEISHGVTRTILWTTLFVLFVHFAFSLLEFTAVV